jgi:uncharacterized membrane protein YeaQ/YmgE (transglycosylase-associated protein family)
MLIGILGWVVLGVIAGFIATKLVNLRGDDPRIGTAAAGAGAFVGGWMYSLISGNPVTYFNVHSLFFAAVAAVLVLVAWHGWRARSAA